MIARVFALLVPLLLSAAPLHSYSLNGLRWTTSPVLMHLQLGTSSGPLLDGQPSWGAAAESALVLWNKQIAAVKFTAVRDSTATLAGRNGVNNVHFASDVYGSAFGTGVLAVTLSYSAGSRQTEGDVIFNNRLSWNSYRGPLRFSPTGGAIYDFHRVALHEFGHVLGLHHPDQAGQQVLALMNSTIGSLDTLAADDISGAQWLYGAATTATPTAPVALPVITSQPVSQAATAGQTVSFSVGVSSTAPVTHQWTRSGVALPGATLASLTLSNVSTANAGSYAVVVANSAGAVTSASAFLTVSTPVAPAPAPVPVVPVPTIVRPTITSSPVSRTVAAGTAVSFPAPPGGTAPLVYQWRKNGIALTGANTPSFSLAAAQPEDAGNYSVLVSNSAGSTVSSGAALTVHVPPVITRQPADQTVIAGGTLELTAAASGLPVPSLQWRRNGVSLPGATASTLTIAAAQPADAGNYSVAASNALGDVTSAIATVAVLVPPAIATQPAAQTVLAGAPVTFGVNATGTPAVRYQWRKNGADLPAATGPTLVIASAQPEDAGDYTVTVTNAAGVVTSGAARLAVKFSRLVNLSTRGFITPGHALTSGFVIRGNGTKNLVVRGVGPALAVFGVKGAVDATRLQLIAAGATSPLLASQSASSEFGLRDAFARVGAFPLPAGSADAAAVTTLAADAYTIRVTAVDPADAGIALAELYDADVLAASARLVNASTLGFVGTGENALTPGFVVRGDAPKRVLIRAVGPGLEVFGVPDRLANPELRVIPLGESVAIASNDDWSDTAELKAAFAAAGAFLLDAGSKDAALVASLAPGAYTVVVSGANGTLGTALVEIYDLDP